MISFPFIATGVMVVAVAFGIMGVGPRVREIGWAVEDTIVWLAERIPVPVLLGLAYLVIFFMLAVAVMVGVSIIEGASSP